MRRLFIRCFALPNWAFGAVALLMVVCPASLWHWSCSTALLVCWALGVKANYMKIADGGTL